MLYNTLRLQLGLDVDSEIQLLQSIDDLINIEKAMMLLKEEFMPDNNFDYQLLKQNIALSEKQIDMKKWAYAPSLNLFYQHTSKKYFSDEETFDMTPPNMIGLALNVPIFSSGSRYEAFNEAKLDHKKQLNVLDDTEESLIIKHRQLCYNLSSAFDRYETQKKNIEVTQRIVDNISRKYEQGMASSLDVTNSGTNLISAQSSYIQVLMELVTAQIDLEELLNTKNK
jgi:outer membrane protein TolC